MRAEKKIVQKYDYKECLKAGADPCKAGGGDIMSKFKELKNEPLKTTAMILGVAAAGLCIVFLIMAAVAPTLMPSDKVGEYMGLLSATTGLGGGAGLLLSGGLSTILVNSIHCRVIFLIGVGCFALCTIILIAKINIKNAWELAAETKK